MGKDNKVSINQSNYSQYSRTPLTRTPKGNEKLFELAGVRINRSWCQISFTMLIINGIKGIKGIKLKV